MKMTFYTRDKALYHVFILAFLTVFLMTNHAMAQIKVGVSRGQVKEIPIAVPFFEAEGADVTLTDLGANMSRVIMNNLESSGLFKPLDRQGFIQETRNIFEKPNFNEWRVINAQGLVAGKVSRASDGRVKVEFRLWDVFAEQQMSGLSYMTTPQNWRRIAHIISDEIYKRLTGEDAYFDTRIVYVSETGAANKRIKRLAIMDQDGENHSFLTDGKTLVLTPRFSPTRQQITYMAYYNNKPRVYIYNINTGRQEVLGDFPGMTFAPRFSPDGKKVIMSLSQNGNSDIYTLDIDSRKSTRLTRNAGIDTSPSFAPDGRQIVFESDRGGAQQLYTMDAAGKQATRITFGKGRYANPVWSPRGDLIAFTKILKGQFYIGVIKPDGSGERLITKAFHVEGPTWSPNGRVLSYFKEIPGRAGRVSKLYSVDLTGFNERQLKTPLGGSDPAWSPLNK